MDNNSNNNGAGGAIVAVVAIVAVIFVALMAVRMFQGEPTTSPIPTDINVDLQGDAQ